MKVSVKQERCEGHGLCEDIAPEVFRLDDEGILALRPESGEVAAELAEKATLAVHTCPVAALLIEG